jgi:DHA1 family tetracycline resistance protein-like MFS transporter
MNLKFKNPLVPIFLIVFVDILGLTIVLPILPFYAQHFGAAPLVVGALVSAYAFCQFISGPILGRWSDRFGRKPVLLISQLGTFVGFLLMAFAPNLWILFLGRIIDGFTAGNITVAQAYISDVTPPEKRVKAFGIIGVSFGLGFLLGPAISGTLVSYGMGAPLFASAGLSFLSIMGTLFLLPKTKPTADSSIEKGLFIPKKVWKRLLSHVDLGPVLIQFFIFSFVFTSFTAGFALFMERRFTWNGAPLGPQEVGYLLAALGLYGVILQGGIVGRLNKLLGEKKMVIWGFLSCFVGFIIFAYTSSYLFLGLSMMITGFGTGILRPALSSLISQSVDKNEQGLVMGVSQSLGSIAQIMAPLLAGFLIDRSMLAEYSLVMSVASAGALFLVYKKGRK